MTDYLQCSSCDYILTLKEALATATRLGEPGSRRCPSCGSEDIRKCLYTEKNIQIQLEWQKEIREKGLIRALYDCFFQGEEN